MKSLGYTFWQDGSLGAGYPGDYQVFRTETDLKEHFLDLSSSGAPNARKRR